LVSSVKSGIYNYLKNVELQLSDVIIRKFSEIHCFLKDPESVHQECTFLTDFVLVFRPTIGFENQIILLRMKMYI